MKFNLVDPPYTLEEYYSKYPEGLTIYEALLSWLETVNQLIDSNNSLDANVEAVRLELDSFLATVPPQIQTVAETILNDWLTDGTLATIINTTIFNQLNDDIQDLDGRVVLLENQEIVIPQLSLDHVEQIAHRGYASQFPENTLLAMQEAIHLGCDFLEMDVQFTSDNVPILMHDLTVDRTTTGTGNVTSFTASAITALDAGTDFSAYYAGVKVPTLQQVIEGTPTAKKYYIEIKNYSSLSQITSLVTWLTEQGYADRVVLQSFTYENIIETIRGANATIMVGALVTDQLDFEAMLPTLDSYSMMLIPLSIASQSNRLLCFEQGLDVGVWTINTHEELSIALKAGFTKVMLNKHMEVIL